MEISSYQVGVLNSFRKNEIGTDLLKHLNGNTWFYTSAIDIKSSSTWKIKIILRNRIFALRYYNETLYICVDFASISLCEFCVLVCLFLLGVF